MFVGSRSHSSEWLRNLARFIGLVCRKYAMDLIGILQVRRLLQPHHGFFC
jgi:hypothetical protein